MRWGGEFGLAGGSVERVIQRARCIGLQLMPMLF